MSLPRLMEIPSHEVLAQLARTDPEAYEAWRRDLIENFIDNAPERLKPRLRGLQWRIECVRKQSRTALGSTIRISDLMWQSFFDLNARWHELDRRVSAVLESGGSPRTLLSHEPALADSAQIIEFRPRRGHRPHSPHSPLSLTVRDDDPGEQPPDK